MTDGGAAAAPGARAPAHGSDPLAVVAGGGRLPLEVARAVAATGRPVILFRIAEEADTPPDDGLESHTFGYGEIGRFLATLERRGVRRIAFAGTIARRPDLSSLAADLGTLRRLPRILKAIVGGDDTVIRKVLALFEAEGYEVVGLADAAPALLAPQGPIGALAATAADRADIATGTRLLAATASFDVGQAVVVAAGRVLAVEAAEGTDAMLARCASLRAAGRARAKGPAGVLVKLPKDGQDRRTDLPVVGLRTVEAAIAAGLKGIAVAAGGTIVVERADAVAAADAAGLFLEGIAP